MEIYAVKSQEQIYNSEEKYLIGKTSALNNFNEGSKIRTILEAISITEADLQNDFMMGLKLALQESVYIAFGFPQLEGIPASGTLKFIANSTVTANSPISIGTAITYNGLTYATTQASAIPVAFILVGNTTTSDATITVSSTSTLAKGMGVAGTGIPAFAVIQSITDLTHFELSINATASNTGINLTFGGTHTGLIPALCTTSTSTANIGVSTINTNTGNGVFVSQPSGVDYGVNDTAFSGGTDTETILNRLNRFNTFILNLAKATVNGLYNAVISVNGVKSCTILDYITSGGTVPVGLVEIYADDGTGNLSSTLQGIIQTKINGVLSDPINYPGYRAAGIHTTVNAPTPQTVAVTAILFVNILDSMLDVDIITLATTAIEVYINTLKLGQTLIWDQLLKSILNCTDSIVDCTLSLPSANVTPSTSAYVIKSGTISLSVTRI
jgi:hypothetical protein